MKHVFIADRVRYRRMTTAELRESFLVSDAFCEGKITLSYVDMERTIVGGAVPTGAPLRLETFPELRAKYFLERRELGVLNLGGAGSVTVDGTTYAMQKLDCLYAGRGNERVEFMSDDADRPAAFYLLSYPAHAEHETALAGYDAMERVKLGSLETCNARTIYKAIHKGGIQSCQLVMGFTLLEPGSNWNTMPPHTHDRRSEVYCYFDVPETQTIVHLMGPPDETRHLLIQDKGIALSPGWSVHAGVGTMAYGFCWGMGGENQDYADMDPAPIAELR